MRARRARRELGYSQLDSGLLVFMRAKQAITPDELLDAYLQARESDAEDRLQALCVGAFYPAARRIVRSRLARFASDHDDVVQDVVTRAATEARAIRAGHAARIRDVVAWTTSAALRASLDYLREVYRPRTQLSNAIRYLLGHSTVFRVWKDETGRAVCGWWRCGETPVLQPGAVATLMEHQKVAERLVSLDSAVSSTVRRVLTSVFALANGRIDRNALVSSVIAASRLSSSLPVELTVVPEPAGAASADELDLERRLLRVIWTAAMTLDEPERLAVLLHLPGKAGLHAFWDRDVVPRPEVASALGLTPLQLDELPWSDLVIADHIDRRRAAAGGRAWVAPASPMSPETRKQRQQMVINLRRDGKRRLEAQLRAYSVGEVVVNIQAGSTSSHGRGSSETGGAHG